MPIRRDHLLTAALLGLAVLLLAGCGPNLFERIDSFWTYGCCGTLIIILDIIAIVELAGSARPLGSKVLWALLIIFFPVLGLLAYWFIAR